jgi:hypothetical protein
VEHGGRHLCERFRDAPDRRIKPGGFAQLLELAAWLAMEQRTAGQFQDGAGRAGRGADCFMVGEAMTNIALPAAVPPDGG